MPMLYQPLPGTYATPAACRHMRAGFSLPLQYPIKPFLKHLNFPAIIPSMAGATTDRKKKKRTSDSVSTRGAKRVCRSQDAGESPSVSVPDIEDFSPDGTLKLRASLLRWYDANHRLLPWRTAAAANNTDVEDRAYAVWVSEVMLQQTRVSVVVGYYNRWMEKWPTVYDLANASQEEVNEVWAGLGYYRRARFLLEGAKSIVERGEFPKTAAALREVRGIGDYTAGAIASIAFNEVIPVVDGNVIRVVARLRAISANPKESATVKSFWKLAGQLVDPFRPGDFNQALMELGATLCSISSPACSACPISDQCRGLTLSKKSESVRVIDYPRKVAKPKQRQDFAAVCIVEIVDSLDSKVLKACNKNGFLLVKRPDKGLLAGLWEFPSVLLGEEATDQDMRRKAIDQYLQKSFNVKFGSNSNVISREDVGQYVHVFSHIRLHMYVELLILSLKGGLKLLQREEKHSIVTWKCVDDEIIQTMGLTSGIRKAYKMIQNFKLKKQSLHPNSAPRKKAKRLK